MHEKARFNEIYVKGSRPWNVYRRHVQKVLVKHNTIILHGMTAAIEKVVKLYMWILDEFPYLEA